MAKLKGGTRVYGGLQVDNTLTVANITISGNLVVTGTTTSVNSTVTQLQDPLFELGGGANGAPLLTDDGKERGILMHYWNGSADTSAYMGWHTSNAQFEFGAAATETSGNVVVGAYGNVKAFHYYGEGDTLGNITGANITGWVNNANFANFAGTVTGASQGNITSLGLLSTLTVGNATANTQFGNGTIDADGDVTFSSATPATSTTSGALIVTGGVGIGGNLYVGGVIYRNNISKAF
jgi:cytoskeletal protein CcmA (bactofilin family)